MDLSIEKQKDEENIKRALDQTRLIRKLQAKVKTLEQSLTQVLMDIQAERKTHEDEMKRLAEVCVVCALACMFFAYIYMCVCACDLSNVLCCISIYSFESYER